MEQRTVTVGDLQFGYLVEGPGDGPLALCLHGFPDTARTFRHLLPRLAAAGFRAVAPWLRGYAPTALAPDGAYQTGALAFDACALHEALGGDADAVVIGHDWEPSPPTALAPTSPSAGAGWWRWPFHRPPRWQRPSSPTTRSSGASTCSSSSRRWPRRRCRWTAMPSSSASGATGRPVTTRPRTWHG